MANEQFAVRWGDKSFGPFSSPEAAWLYFDHLRDDPFTGGEYHRYRQEIRGTDEKTNSRYNVFVLRDPEPTALMELKGQKVARENPLGCGCPHEGACPHHKHPPEVPTIPVVCDAPPAASENPVEVPPPPGACLPFVYVAVDVENFEACMKNAERYGKLDNARLVYDFLSPWYHRRDQEIFLVVLFDVRHQLRGVNQVAIGQRSRVNTGLDDLRRVITLAGAERFVVAHNHPTGKASPSDDDKALTKVIKKEFKDSPNLVFEDHVIVGRGEFYSFHEKKMFTV